MTNRKARRTSSAGETRTTTRTDTLFWPDILLEFGDWLLESGWAEDSLSAYSVVFAVDRSTRERGFFVDGDTLPLGIFELDGYDETLYVDGSHAPWTNDDVVVAIGLFAMFAAATNLSPSQYQEIYDFAEVMIPNSPRPATPARERQSANLGRFAFTTHLQKLAERSMTYGHVPAACLDNPDESEEVVRALGLHICLDCDTCADLPATINFGVIVAVAVGVGVLQGSGHELTTGPAASAWLETPTTDQLRESVVAAYQSCLAPVVNGLDEPLMFDVAAAATLTTTMLIRSLVEDPLRDSDGVCIAPTFNGEVVAAFSKMRLVSMIDLELMVVVNHRFCIPDVLAPFLIEALDRDRRKRHDHG